MKSIRFFSVGTERLPRSDVQLQRQCVGPPGPPSTAGRQQLHHQDDMGAGFTDGVGRRHRRFHQGTLDHF